jgi:hypothetical protein
MKRLNECFSYSLKFVVRYLKMMIITWSFKNNGHGEILNKRSLRLENN